MPEAAGTGGYSPYREDVVLGAGFSHAVSAQFPLTKELGPLALDAAGVPDGQRPGGGTGFEAWLSRIAEDQPYRSVAENLEARALFTKMSSAIGRVLGARQSAALQGGPPAWLEDFVSVLHARCATVVSFNYDNVLECAVDGHCLTDPVTSGAPRQVSSHDILDRLPPLPPAILSEELPTDASAFEASVGKTPCQLPAGPAVAGTFRLLKLHGSLSWYWAPDDTTGATLQRWRPPAPFGWTRQDDEAERRRALPGRVPFIVPPTATKSPYLTNPVAREIWGRAREALSRAQRLIVIGYSVPTEDQVACGLLAETLGGRDDVEVTVVDPCARAVSGRLEGLGIAPPIACFDKPCCVEDFTARYRGDHAASVLGELRGWAQSTGAGSLQGQVLVDWGKCRDRRCVALGPLGHRWWVDVDAIRASSDGQELIVPLLRNRSPVREDETPRLVRSLSDHPMAKRLVVLTPDNRQFAVLSYTAAGGGYASEQGAHLTLVPSGHPRPLNKPSETG